ncbi:hypothetical protein DYD83_21680 [Dickeya fangzhongdai]|uniref:Uncharacterized protein n=1 Tax=Dickeya fangzhongdai TaxID=1778540 RepID=A0A2K8QSC8_9GAMM|nr:hypothetical protein CVE23_21600 [Dickeya fangzhongdai]AYH49991.1 hypothetical protein B6N31_21250 [Dickeya fangzhongdai]QOH49780.1 hypothetical protein DYD82_21680 [Dickeya fangzhongdai]QOH54084.1 hypothetical protein DYD83_21680 [Dickeya fangzhongdai]
MRRKSAHRLFLLTYPAMFVIPAGAASLSIVGGSCADSFRQRVSVRAGLRVAGLHAMLAASFCDGIMIPGGLSEETNL